MENQVAKKAGIILSWLGFLLFLVIFINMLQAPRIAIGTVEREIMRNFHLVAGTFLMAVSMFRVYLWVHFPPQKNQRLLPEQEYTFIHFLQFSLYCSFVAQGISGFLMAWSDGVLRFMKGIDTIDHGLWTTSGYLHSAFGFFYIMLILIIINIRLYHMLRYRVFSLNIFA